DLARKADGTIDIGKVAAQIRTLFQQGVRDVRIREQGLSAQDMQRLADLAQQLGAQLGLERVRVREDGNRLRIDLRANREAREERLEQRRELAREDRREDRAERREDRRERMERPQREQRAERPERNERAE